MTTATRLAGPLPPLARDAESPAGQPTVGWADIGIAAAVAAILYAAGIALIWAVPQEPAGPAGVVQYAVSGLAPLGAFVAVLWLRVKDPRLLGLRPITWKWALISVAIGVGAIALSLLITIVVITVFGPPSNLQADYQASASAGLGWFALTLIAGALLTPLGEELLFRGVLANGLAQYGPWVAIAGSSAVFAVAHGINYILPVAFVVGLAAALLLRRTGSVWPGVIVHAVNNSYAAIVPALLSLAGRT